MAWYDTLENYLVQNRYRCGAIDNTFFIKQSGSHTILAQVYVNDIIFGLTNECLRKEFAKVMAHKFKMSMIGELPFFLGLQVKQLPDGIFIYQSKYMQDMLKQTIFTKGVYITHFHYFNIYPSCHLHLKHLSQNESSCQYKVVSLAFSSTYKTICLRLFLGYPPQSISLPP